MYRPAVILTALWLLNTAVYAADSLHVTSDSLHVTAADSLPVIEVKADRTMIYPQRMELTGEESLLDILQMVPDLMMSGYEDALEDYNLRIDNCPINSDTRLVLTQMKAKDIAKIQVCSNTGVAKGTIGTANVLDINMLMPESVKGFAEAQGGFGTGVDGNGTVNVLYGSQRTDLYANASYRYKNRHEEHLSLHMTNRFDDRNRLLTYLTQQYVELPGSPTHKVLARARYFHTFNEIGTELLVLGGYQYATDTICASQLPMFVVELNTPLPAKGLSLLAGVEGDYLMSRQKDTDRNWHIFNHDIYLQLTYAMPRWRFMAGTRVMFYNYRLTDGDATQRYMDVRNNTSVSVTCIPNHSHQVQVGYFRKFHNPAYLALFMESTSVTSEEWAKVKGLLDERTINQIKAAYAYTRRTLTVQTEASYYINEGEDNYAELNASAYWRTKWLMLTGGAEVYFATKGVFASLRLTPTVYLPNDWQIGAQIVYFTPKSPNREVFGTPVYGCLSVNKQIRSRWNLGLDWHDMFDALCRSARLNRHAINLKLQCRF